MSNEDVLRQRIRDGRPVYFDGERVLSEERLDEILLDAEREQYEERRRRVEENQASREDDVSDLLDDYEPDMESEVEGFDLASDEEEE